MPARSWCGSWRATRGIRLTAAMGSATRKRRGRCRRWRGSGTARSCRSTRRIARRRRSTPCSWRCPKRRGRDGAGAARARRARHRSVGRVPAARRRRARQAVVSGDRGAAGWHGLRPDRAAIATAIADGAAGLVPGLLSDRRAARAGAAGSAPACSTGDVIIDAKSGISGAGKAPTDRTHFSENHGSVAAYGAVRATATRRRSSRSSGAPVTFVPHLVPLDRGILETIYARVTPGTTARAGRRRRFERAYADAPFVRLTGDDAAGDQARGAHQLLRHRLEGR